MTTGKYLVCILGLAGCASLLTSRNQPAPRVKLPAGIAAVSKSSNTETLARPTVATTAGNRLQAPFATTAASGRAAPMSLPITLEENVGQAEKRVAFLGRGKGMTALVTRTGIEVFVGARAGEKGTGGMVKLRFVEVPTGSRSSSRASREFVWRGKQRLRGESNYFLGSDARRWRTHVAHYERAEARDIVPGVGIAVYGNEEGIEYDLRLAPGTDVDRLRVEVSGADGIRLDPEGNLVMVVADRPVMMRKPAIFVEHVTMPVRGGKNGGSMLAAREQVDGGYVLEADGSLGFRVGPHDSNATLVLDPSLSVSYATFLGGAGEDSANSIALDSTEKVYVGGTTTSATTFPEPDGKQNGPGGGATDFFIAKIDPAASGANSLVYLTFLGGSGDEAGGQIAVDGSGNVAIMGTTTSTDFPVTDASKRTSGSNDLAISEIGPSGSSLIFSTLLGGSGAEATQNAGGIAFDKSANIFIASDTTSSDLTATPGAFHAAYGGGTSDGLLAVFRPSATPPTPHLKYCTYLGINAQVGVGGVAVDGGGNAYIAGFTSNPGASFLALNGFQSVYGGGPSDGFLMKIRPSGTGAGDLAYGTFLGGAALDKALAVTVGTAMPATAYVTGATASKNFPMNGTNAGPQTSLKGTVNAFFAAVAQDATTVTSLIYSTYLGGSQSDQGQSVAVTAGNAAYVAGKTTSYDFPWLGNFQPFNGDEDAFIAKLDPTAAGVASLIYASPLGGTAPAGVTAVAEGNAIVADSTGHLYLAGRTTAADFPRAGNPGNGIQPTCASCQTSQPAADAFVVAIQESGLAAPSVSFTAPRINFESQLIGAQNIPPLFAGVVNTGNAPLNVASLDIIGPNASDFALVLTEACMTAPIPPGPACSFEVSFAPSTGGPEKAFLTFTDDGPASPQVLEVVGIGKGPLAVPSPASLSFGNQPVGTMSAPQFPRLTNLGNQGLNITVFGHGGTGIVQFTVMDDPSCHVGPMFTLAPGSSCTFTVTFVPKAVGQFQAEIDVFDDSGNVPGAEQVIPLTGTGTSPAPIVNLLPAQLLFGTQAAGTVSAGQTVALKNSGSAALTLTGVGFTGNDAGSFGIVAAGPSPCPIADGTLAIAASCTVAVDFAPQSGGTKSASLSFTDNAPGSPQTVPIKGDAIAPVIQISPGSLNFAVETVGMTSAAQTVTLSNTGDGPLAITNISLTGASPADFKQTNNCPPSLGNGNACSLSVTFTPTAPGNRSASINIVDNAPGSPHAVPLTGVGALPGVSIAPTTIDFAAQLVGTSSSPVNITVKNAGTGLLVISKISFTGANAAEFTETKDTCSVTINPNDSCTIPVVFDPATIGSKTAVLTLADNAPGSPQSVAVSGTAMDFSIGPANGGPMSATVKAGDPATYQLQVMSQNGFAGTVSFSQCEGNPPASTCNVAPTMVTVAANSTSAFQVNVTTTAQSLTTPRTTFPLGSPRRIPLARLVPAGSLLLFWTAILALFGLAPLRLAARCSGRRGRLGVVNPVHAALVWILLAGTLVSCGGSGTGAVGNSGTPAGTSTLTVTATVTAGSSKREQIIPLTLTVLPTTH
jgi:hypothetical protein